MKIQNEDGGARLIRGTKAYRVAVYSVALLTITLLLAVPVFILGALDLTSRSWFWVIFGVATVEALAGCTAVIGLMVTARGKRVNMTDARYIAAMMRYSLLDLRSLLRSGKLPRT